MNSRILNSEILNTSRASTSTHYQVNQNQVEKRRAVKKERKQGEFVSLLPKPQFINPRFYQKVETSEEDPLEYQENEKASILIHAPLFRQGNKNNHKILRNPPINKTETKDIKRTLSRFDSPMYQKIMTFGYQDSPKISFFTFGKTSRLPEDSESKVPS